MGPARRSGGVRDGFLACFAVLGAATCVYLGALTLLAPVSCGCTSLPPTFAVQETDAPAGMLGWEVTRVEGQTPLRYADVWVMAGEHPATRDVAWLASRGSAPLVAEDALRPGDVLLVDVSGTGDEEVRAVSLPCNCVVAWWPPRAPG